MVRAARPPGRAYNPYLTDAPPWGGARMPERGGSKAAGRAPPFDTLPGQII